MVLKHRKSWLKVSKVSAWVHDLGHGLTVSLSLALVVLHAASLVLVRGFTAYRVQQFRIGGVGFRA